MRRRPLAGDRGKTLRRLVLTFVGAAVLVPPIWGFAIEPGRLRNESYEIPPEISIIIVRSAP